MGCTSPADWHYGYCDEHQLVMAFGHGPDASTAARDAEIARLRAARESDLEAMRVSYERDLSEARRECAIRHGHAPPTSASPAGEAPCERCGGDGAWGYGPACAAKCPSCNGSGRAAKMAGAHSEPDKGEASSRAMAPVVPGASHAASAGDEDYELAMSLGACLSDWQSGHDCDGNGPWSPVEWAAHAVKRHIRPVLTAARDAEIAWLREELNDYQLAARVEAAERRRLQAVLGVDRASRRAAKTSASPDGRSSGTAASAAVENDRDRSDIREQTGTSPPPAAPSDGDEVEALERSARTLIACIIDWSSEAKRFKGDVEEWAKHVVSRHYRPILAAARREAYERAAKAVEHLDQVSASRIRALGENP